MRYNIRPLAGFVLGCVSSFGMLMALGAANPPGRAFPRYSVDSGGGELKITDNDRDELFLYNSSHDEQGMPSYRLRGVVKLIETGQAELRPKKGEK